MPELLYHRIGMKSRLQGQFLPPSGLQPGCQPSCSETAGTKANTGLGRLSGEREKKTRLPLDLRRFLWYGISRQAVGRARSARGGNHDV